MCMHLCSRFCPGRCSEWECLNLAECCSWLHAALWSAITERTGRRFKLAVEGRDLLAALGTLGVVGMRSTTNHVMEALRVLGIEAARSTIMREIHRTMGAHGMTIDTRHTMLLADLMTYKARAPLLTSSIATT